MGILNDSIQYAIFLFNLVPLVEQRNSISCFSSPFLGGGFAVGLPVVVEATNDGVYNLHVSELSWAVRG